MLHPLCPRCLGPPGPSPGYSDCWFAVMRVVVRMTCLVVVASGTITCLAAAQPSAPSAAPPPLRAVPTVRKSAAASRLSFDLIDPWSEEAVHSPEARAPSAPDSEIIDPWTGSSPGPVRQPEMFELVDPWRDEPRPIPTASFPLIDPWQDETKP